jgi:hypothetical protein
MYIMILILVQVASQIRRGIVRSECLPKVALRCWRVEVKVGAFECGGAMAVLAINLTAGAGSQSQIDGGVIPRKNFTLRAICDGSKSNLDYDSRSHIDFLELPWPEAHSACVPKSLNWILRRI